MLIIDGIFMPRFLLTARFGCRYSECKGACCVEGERGAPILETEIERIATHWPEILSGLHADAIQQVESDGFYEGNAGDRATVCTGGSGRCVFAIPDADGMISCSLETLSDRKKIPTLRPLSCRLFPLRIRSCNGLAIIDYEIWEPCRKSWHCETYLLDFCREALIEKFGVSWIEKLDCARLKHRTTS